MTDEDLHSFANLHEDSTSDGQTELYIYICFLIFVRTRSTEYLGRAIQRTEGWIAVTGLDHPDGGRRFQILDMMSARIYQLTNIPEEPLPVQIGERSVSQSLSPASISEEADRLIQNYQRTGSMDDLNRAVEVGDMAVNAIPQGHSDRARYLNNLGHLLGTRFNQMGSMDDLNRAIKVIDIAVNATPQDHSNQATYLKNLGKWLGRRFERTGSIDDLNRAVNFANIAVNSTPPDHPARAGRLDNLGLWLGRRSDRTGSIDDLNRAVEVGDMVVNSTPQDHPYRASRLSNLASSLSMRLGRTGSIDDLNRAVEVGDMAVNAIPQGHSDRASYLYNLGIHLWARYQQTRVIDDIRRAIKVADIAVNTTPQDHPNRASRLNNLGLWLGLQFERTGSMDDLNRAIEVIDMALNTIPQDHPKRASSLNGLGYWLSRRFYRTKSMEDLNLTLSCFKEGWACHASPPSVRISLAQHAANILASQRMWEGASDFLQGAVKLLPIISPRLLDNSDKQHILKEFAGLASMAAAISLAAGKDEYNALELLELGRCVIAGLLLEMRTDISDLRGQHPRLAAEFESLRNELDSPSSRTPLLGNTAPSREIQVDRRPEVDQKFNKVIAKIRDQFGFRNFLLPPTSDELMAAADQGPIIIINVSSYRCDAFLIKKNRITVLPLPDLKEKELKTKVSQQSVGSAQTLQWLWDVAAGPVLDALGYQCPPPDNKNLPRVWWITTGVLSHFPIHAAGYHAKGSTKTVLDRVMSSYSSSIKALVYGRRYSVRRATESTPKQALLVAMQKTPSLLGGSALPFATKEVEMLACLCPSLQLKPVIPLKRREEVLAHLRTCKIFHFAGHGRSDPQDPSRSYLLLDDWNKSPLTVGDLRDSNIQESSPFLGYLSACSTSVNKVDSLVDEGIHLASAFQLAGFRHVIGTLWEVSDSYCVDVARVVYETIRDEGMTDMAVCRGLHRAVKALRDVAIGSTREARDAGDLELSDEELCNDSCETTLQSPLCWAPYIHFGV
ncbi:hypothetical protein K469DRAFT_665117 [Zopfia rhizophila CBS 207.26]|uniref:CHAT domain-containing protein n=1 Tax=Zopfia rhizophila CBS 207.26 TaxID=1314779 RepID=A0A6A6E4H2_9PEZI|nr:hypothetical protein K469DRAFT_665117 [Zopfia rhizophila CBS 207.26]